MTALFSAPVPTSAARDRLAVPARGLLGLATVISVVVPLLFGAFALTSVGGPEFLTWMATWGTPIAYSACTAIIMVRWAPRARGRRPPRAAAPP